MTFKSHDTMDSISLETPETSNDIVECDVLEAAKENIQPLKSGRRVTALSAVLSTPHHQRDIHLSSTRTRLRASVDNALSSNTDPLSAYVDLIYWTIEHYPQGHSAESGILELLEEATRTLKDDGNGRYRGDLRYLKLWVLYASYIERPSVIYAFLLANEIGTNHALFYEEYAIVLERDGRRPKADEIYLLGIARRAEPLDHLQNRHKEFQKRMMASVLTSDNSQATIAPVSQSQLIAASKRKVLGDRATVAATVVSSSLSTSTPSPRLQVFTDPTPPKSKPNGRMQIFIDGIDGNEENGSTSEWPDIGTRKSRVKENLKEVTKMSGTKFKQGHINSRSGLGMEKIIPYRDPELLDAVAEQETVNVKENANHSQSEVSEGSGIMKQKLSYSSRISSEAEALRKDPFKNYDVKIVIDDDA